jgi:hypothetical protein
MRARKHADRANNKSRLPSRRVLAATVAAFTVGCQQLPPPHVVPARSETLVAGLNAMSESCLQQLYLRCSSEAMQGRLGSGEIAGCSVVYETLLMRDFGGDFHALLMWSRQQPDDAGRNPDALEDCWPRNAQTED